VEFPGQIITSTQDDWDVITAVRKTFDNAKNVVKKKFKEDISNKNISNKRVFIYLDAHCHDDLPLKQEIETICKTWKEFVIMIDDFQVPGDKGYGYDSYAGNQTLSISNFLPVFLQNGLTPFFPALSSGGETGAKRGNVILTRKGNFAEQVG